MQKALHRSSLGLLLGYHRPFSYRTIIFRDSYLRCHEDIKDCQDSGQEGRDCGVDEEHREDVDREVEGLDDVRQRRAVRHERDEAEERFGDVSSNDILSYKHYTNLIYKIL